MNKRGPTTISSKGDAHCRLGVASAESINDDRSMLADLAR